MDTLTVTQRSERMSRIRSKDTKPELLLRSALHSIGYRYRVHQKDLPGSPDLVFASRRKVIFVHGCFWHGHEECNVANVPKTRTAFWREKFSRNQARDQKNEESLRAAGWDVMVVWECELKARQAVVDRVKAFLGPPKRAS